MMIKSDKSEHFFKCELCGQMVDMRDLRQVFEHGHKGLPIPKKVKSKKVYKLKYAN